MNKEQKFFLVIESMVDANGNFGELHNFYLDENQAYAKYYTILSAAAVSSVPYHAAFIIRDDGITIEGRIFDRRESAQPQDEGGET